MERDLQPGKTFSQYLAHLQKASALTNMSPAWLTPAASAMSKGLQNAHYSGIISPTFIEPGDVILF